MYVAASVLAVACDGGDAEIELHDSAFADVLCSDIGGGTLMAI